LITRVSDTARSAGLILLLLASLTGCSVYSAVPVSQAPAVEPGDHVRITTRDNVTLEFELLGIEGGALSDGQQSVPLAEIESLEVRHVNRRTLFITLGVVAGALLIIDEQNDSCTPSGVFGCVENAGIGF